MDEQITAPTRAREVAQGLRELADWLEERPDIPVMNAWAMASRISAHGQDGRERFIALATQIDEPTPERTIGINDYRISRKFAGGVSYEIVCDERVFAEDPPRKVRPWPEEIRVLAPDADWGEGS